MSIHINEESIESPLDALTQVKNAFLEGEEVSISHEYLSYNIALHTFLMSLQSAGITVFNASKEGEGKAITEEQRAIIERGFEAAQSQIQDSLAHLLDNIDASHD